MIDDSLEKGREIPLAGVLRLGWRVDFGKGVKKVAFGHWVRNKSRGPSGGSGATVRFWPNSAIN
jgi:hypothetical protein